MVAVSICTHSDSTRWPNRKPRLPSPTCDPPWADAHHLAARALLRHIDPGYMAEDPLQYSAIGIMIQAVHRCWKCDRFHPASSSAPTPLWPLTLLRGASPGTPRSGVADKPNPSCHARSGRYTAAGSPQSRCSAYFCCPEGVFGASAPSGVHCPTNGISVQGRACLRFHGTSAGSGKIFFLHHLPLAVGDGLVVLSCFFQTENCGRFGNDLALAA